MAPPGRYDVIDARSATKQQAIRFKANVVAAVCQVAIRRTMLDVFYVNGLAARIVIWPMLAALATATTTLFLSFRVGEVALGGLAIAQVFMVHRGLPVERRPAVLLA